MDVIAVSELRANITKIIKKVEQGASINITSRGNVVAKLVPPGNTKEIAKTELNKLRKNAFIGDIISPVDSDWDAAK
jgi:prevent-host-death family protein